MELTELLTSQWWWWPSAILTFTLIAYFLKNIILGYARRVADKTTTELDELFLSSVNFPLTLIIFATGLYATVQHLTNTELITERFIHYAQIGFKITVVIALVMFIERSATYGVNYYNKRSDVFHNSSGIIKTLLRALIIGLGLLVLLGTLGIAITPVIASLGITSLAVALALQPTLENFFSGMQIIADKPIRVGDFIELDDSLQGYVERIGWRSTWIRMLPNNMIIIPNSEIANSRIKNFYYPQQEMSVPVDCGVHYDSDLEMVEQVTLEVAKQVLKDHPGGVESYQPFVIYHTFDNSSINFTVMLRVDEYVQRFFIKSMFIKRLQQRYSKEGIVIPFPITAVNLQQEGVEQWVKPAVNHDQQ